MLDIDLNAFIATIIIFLGLIAFLNAKLYKPLLSFMDEREACIKRDEANAEKNFSEIGENKAQIEAILNEARDEAGKIKDTAMQEIKSKTQKEIEEKREDLEKEYNKYLQELDEQKQELKNSLKIRVPEFKSSIKDSLAKI